MEQILSKLRSVKLFLSSHPDNEENSEFSDRISDIQELQKEVSNLIEWKKSAMNIFSEIDLQAIGKELNIGLGQSVSENLLSKIQLHTEKNRIPVSGSLPSKDEAVNVGFRKATNAEYNFRKVCRDLDHDLYYSGWMDCYDWLSGNDH